MNRTHVCITGIILLTVALFMVSCSSGSDSDIFLYVSTRGNDAWSGGYPDPTEDGADGPFATFQRAREEIRRLKQKSGMSPGKIIVSFREGIYEITESMMLNHDDTGTEEKPVVWCAYRDETVRFIGGRMLHDFEAVEDPTVLSRLKEDARNKVLQISLKEHGIDDYGTITSEGWRDGLTYVTQWGGGNQGMELFINREPMRIARYPNEGWLTISSVPQAGDSLIMASDGVPASDIPAESHVGALLTEDSLSVDWDIDDIWVYGYWKYDWADEYHPVQAVDQKKGVIRIKPPYHVFGYSSGQHFYFLNVLEELDMPGEYYINRDTGVLYFWPPDSDNNHEMYVSILDEPLLLLENTDYVNIRGIIIEGCRGNGIELRGGANNTITGCTVRNTGKNGIVIDGGTQNGVVSCDVYNNGDAGITINGGDRETLSPSGHYAENNHVHHFSRINRTYRSGISLNGVGNRMSYNYIHDSPHEGTRFHGNDHVIEYNEYTRIATETGDVPTIGSSHDWTFRGTIIRYNYFHEIHGPGELGCRIVYLDLPVGGTHIYGNIFYDVDMAFFTNSGRDIIIENNMFFNSDLALGFNSWKYPELFQPDGPWGIFERLHAMPFDKPPYSTKYPGLLRIFHDGDPSIPTGNKVLRNISNCDRFLQFWDNDIDFGVVEVRDNVIADRELLYRSNKPFGTVHNDYTLYTRNDSEMRKTLESFGNIITDATGVRNPGAGDFTLNDDSPAHDVGFEAIPIDRIGLYMDEFRTVLPQNK